jgi:hypothetical protein
MVNELELKPFQPFKRLKPSERPASGPPPPCTRGRTKEGVERLEQFEPFEQHLY